MQNLSHNTTLNPQLSNTYFSMRDEYSMQHPRTASLHSTQGTRTTFRPVTSYRINS